MGVRLGNGEKIVLQERQTGCEEKQAEKKHPSGRQNAFKETDLRDVQKLEGRVAVSFLLAGKRNGILLWMAVNNIFPGGQDVQV